MNNDSQMSNLGNLTYFLGMEFVNTKDGVFLHQKKYAKDIFKKFKMRNFNLVITLIEIRTKYKK